MAMDKHYDPTKIEGKWYEWWEKHGLFHATPDEGGEPYAVVIPPPNVTGILHMGHALNNTIQDILVRWRRMQGRNVVWMPGTDHAGIATQNVVEKSLRKQGLSRRDLGRDAFIEKVWAWRREYGDTIVRQLRRLGASCDWSRLRFTMDEGLSESVVEVFCRLYDEGLIYRGHYIVNWCPRCHTALADEESEHCETQGHLWHIRYPIEGGGHVTVATTRPETMLGDTAVAVHPDDARYRDLPGRKVMLPLLDRPLRVVCDEYVDPAFGTGVVKITPAHDPNDFLMGQRHQLESINVMEGDGTMNAAAGPYSGLDRFECRKRVVADLDKLGLLEKVEDHQHAVGHCYRCDTVVEPRLSRQWFVRMKPLAEPAIEAVRSGQVRFVPERWEKVYLDWLENIRDWCISRQIWWGHRIPVYTCGLCRHEWAAKTAPTTCPACGRAQAGDIRQDEDVLDTWFSSWLWPFSTFGWPHENADLKFYYPTHDLVTASEIIFFWVARMVMAGQKFMGEIPFRRVHIHGTVRDDQGRKMSKSLGNSLDPLEIVEQYSADALRFSLMMITATGQDVQVSLGKFEIGRNFGTKIWNAARFLRMHMEKVPDMDWAAAAVESPVLDAPLLSDDDRHLLARCDAAVTEVTSNLERLRFQDAALAIYDFVWRSFCDGYLEYAKTDLQGDPARRRQVLLLMTHVFSKALRLLHPYMPFLTEELWHAMGYGGEQDSIMRAPWPGNLSAEDVASWGITSAVTEYVEAKQELIGAGRALRAEYGIAPGKPLRFVIHAIDVDTAKRLTRDRVSLHALLRAETVEISTGGDTRGMPGTIGKLGSIHLPLAGVVDIPAEIRRIAGDVEKQRQQLKGVEAKLGNAAFLAKAPSAVVEQQRVKADQIQATIARLEALARTLLEVD